MNIITKNLKYLCLYLWLLQFFVKPNNGEYYEECEGKDDEEFVASSVSCRDYIYCMGNDSMIGECGDGEYFNSEEFYCDLEENVYCPLDSLEEPEEPEEPDIKTTTERTTTTTKTDTTAIITSAPSTMEPTIDPITISPIIKNNCPLTDDPNQIIFVPSKDSCADYFLCYHGHATQMHCTNHLHFNEHTGKCDFPENAQCLVDRPSATKCLPHVIDYFPHPQNCNYFYYCAKGFLMIQQCPFDYGWDIEKRSCVVMSTAKCFNGSKNHR